MQKHKLKTSLILTLCILCTFITACNPETTQELTTVNNLTTTTSNEASQTTETEEDITETTTTEAVTTVETTTTTRIIPELSEELKNSKYDMTIPLSETPLKDAYAKYFTLGVAINGNSPSNASIQSPELAAIMKHHYNSTVYANLMKSTSLLSQRGCFENAVNGSQTDVAVKFDSCIPGFEFAKENGMVMRGHTLIWHKQTPDWFFKVDYKNDGDFVDKEIMLARMESYIKQVLEFTQENYPGIVFAWDVVNEAVETAVGQYDMNVEWQARTHAGDKENLWYTVIGADYVEKAFEYARKYAASDVKLFYNDYNTFDSIKNFAICNLLTMLKEKGLIDGVGMQSNYGLSWPSSLNSVKTALNNFSQIGIEIHMTEVSINIGSKDYYEAQASRFKEFFKLLLEMHVVNGGSANITNVTFFGLMDCYLFYDNNQNREWLFDEYLQPKLAFYAVLDAVREYEEK